MGHLLSSLADPQSWAELLLWLSYKIERKNQKILVEIYYVLAVTT